jgi:putative glycosyltransferase (TIGR04372 family)
MDIQLKNFFGRVKSSISFLQRVISSAFYILRYNKHSFKVLENSNVVNRTFNFDPIYFHNKWLEANKLDYWGAFHDSVELRVQILNEISYLQSTVGGRDNFRSPSIMSVGWTHSIGHLGHLGTFTIARQLGLVENNERIVNTRQFQDLLNLEILFGDTYQYVNFQFGYTLLENPSNWHNLEFLLINRTNIGLKSMYELTDLTFGHALYNNKQNKLTLPQTYSINARRILENYGLPRNSWFVGLHIREKPNSIDPRNANLSNYILAIEDITSRGGWIIRFGTGIMTPLPKMKNVIDLNSPSIENMKTHYYILANAKFLLSTHSGPLELAKAFGTPVVATNMIGIGKAIMRAPKGSIYLPKQWSKKGKPMGYKEIVSCSEGYSVKKGIK